MYGHDPQSNNRLRPLRCEQESYAEMGMALTKLFKLDGVRNLVPELGAHGPITLFDRFTYVSQQLSVRAGIGVR